MADRPQDVQPVYIKPRADLGGVTGPGSVQLFDISKIDATISAKGVKLVHYKAMPCPVGRQTKEDSARRSHADHNGCLNGFFYVNSGQATCLFSSNSNSKNFLDAGISENDRISATIPRFYDNTQTRVIAMPFDRFYLAEGNIVVEQWELAEWSGSGFDALKFPIVEAVQPIIDWRGEQYIQGVDFTIKNGKIAWGKRNPGLNLETGTGALYSCRYTYHPFYIVDSLGHEIRIAHALDSQGQKIAVPMPYQVQLVRETVPRSADNDPLSKAPKSNQQVADNQAHFDNTIFVDQL